MLVLRPYSIPIKPSRDQVTRLLGNHGFLIGAKDRKLDDGGTMTLKRWAREKPEFETIEKNREYAIIRVFIHYIEDHPNTDFNINTRKTKENWQPHRLSRIVTLWIPLKNNSYDFLLSVGNIDEEDVKILFNNLLPDINSDDIKGEEFDFEKVREQNDKGWLHGCQNRPKTIQTGIFYGDFDFKNPGELHTFYDKPDGTKSNQEGIILSKENGLTRDRKVRILKHGKFQLIGIPKQNFYGDKERKKARKEVIKESFITAFILLNTTA